MSHFRLRALPTFALVGYLLRLVHCKLLHDAQGTRAPKAHDALGTRSCAGNRTHKAHKAMLALLVATSAFSELNEAHRAFVAAPESGKAAAQALLGKLYARQGMQASAKFFFERALKAEPHTEEAKTGLAALAAVPPPQAEAQLGSLAQRLFGSGQLDLGLRADLARLTSLAARDESGESPVAARDALNRASLLLLASGLDAHPVAVARQLLAGGATGCGVPCMPPALLLHEGEPHGVSMAEARRFVGCCLATDNTLERLLTTRKASVTEANDFGYTPLHFAAMADQPALALALVARGANASAQTLFSQTPLHLAAQRNATAAIEALLRDEAVRAVAAVPDASQRSAAQVACQLGFSGAAALLDASLDCKPFRLTLGDNPEKRDACKFDVRRPSEVTATRTPQPLATSEGRSHASHTSHASHASHASHTSHTSHTLAGDRHAVSRVRRNG